MSAEKRLIRAAKSDYMDALHDHWVNTRFCIMTGGRNHERSTRDSNIDGDGHIMEDNAGIIAHMKGAYREIAARKGICFPPLDHLHSGRAVETPPQRDQRPPVGPKGWLEFLDDVGIDWTVMYPTLALSYGKIVSRDYALAVCKAYNDWMTETI